jgi:hypothetical protein
MNAEPREGQRCLRRRETEYRPGRDKFCLSHFGEVPSDWVGTFGRSRCFLATETLKFPQGTQKARARDSDARRIRWLTIRPPTWFFL